MARIKRVQIEIAADLMRELPEREINDLVMYLIERCRAPRRRAKSAGKVIKFPRPA